jgi:hypothetical protein
MEVMASLLGPADQMIPQTFAREKDIALLGASTGAVPLRRFRARAGRIAGSLVIALSIGVRFENGIPVAWGNSAARAADRMPKDDEALLRHRAKELLVEGVDLIRRGQYQTALERFDAAYSLVPSPNIYYDRALAYLGLRRPAAALEAFEAFLAESTHPPPGKREEAQSHQTQLLAQVARLDTSALPPGAEVIVDGSGRGKTPLPRSVYLDPGPHEISIFLSTSAARISQPVEARAGQVVAVELHPDPPAVATLAPTAATPLTPQVDWRSGGGPPPASHLGLYSTSAIVAAAGGIVLLGVGATFGILAQRAGDSLTRDSQRATPTQPVFYDPGKQQSGRTDQRLEVIFLGAGAATLGASIVLFGLNRHHAAERSASGKSILARAGSAATGSPLLGPGLVGANVRMQF